MAAMVKVARIDHDRVYFGLDDKALADVVSGDVVFGDAALCARLPAGAVYVGRDCDLPGGRYQWDGKAFQPLPPQLQKKAESAPDLERAFYEQCRCLHGRDATLVSAPALEWCVAYERGFDSVTAQGVDIPTPLGTLRYFREALGLLKGA